MGFGERAAQRWAAMPAGTEADSLFGIVEIGPAFVIFAFEAGQIDQHLLGRRLAGKVRWSCADLFHDTGLRLPDLAAYWAIVWSLENWADQGCTRCLLKSYR